MNGGRAQRRLVDLLGNFLRDDALAQPGRLRRLTGGGIDLVNVHPWSAPIAALENASPAALETVLSLL